MPTRLDYYKDHYGCRHDGETVLHAASMGEFAEQHTRSIVDNVVYMRVSLAEMLKRLGIRPSMPRKKILRRLQNYRALGTQAELTEVIEHEARAIRTQIQNLPQSVSLHPRADNENAIKEAARKRIMGILDMIIRFCGDEVKE